jgi:HEAT repeat protein
MRVLVLVAVVGCGSPKAPPAALVPSSTRLAPPVPIDPAVHGASYLTAVAAQLQLRWGAFLEDCRLRLPASHPLNQTTLAATFDLAIGPGGAIVRHTQVATSGNGDFDTAAADVLADASPLPAPPAELVSDDGLVHLRWQFARDRRQAGSATARVLTVELPLIAVVSDLIGRGELARAARRVAAAPEADPARGAATERVMIAVIREALASPDGAARRAAVEACGGARIHELASAVRGQLAATTDPALRRTAITTVGALGDRAAAPALLGALRDDLVQRSPLALARIGALAAVGQAEEAAGVVRAVLDAGPNPIALAALGVVPIPALVGKLAAGASDRDPAMRGAVCAALPRAAPAQATALIERGLHDAEATVRATCADAAARAGAPGGTAAAPVIRRLHDLVRDRDRSVRARAVAALARLDPGHLVRAVDDPAPEVRAAFAPAATELELRTLVSDRDPEVRATAIAALAALGSNPANIGVRGRLHDAAERAAGDPSPAVRRAAIAALDGPDALARLGRDDSPEVATAALIRLTALGGRAALTTQLLEQVAAAPAGSPERVRIALAWLLAS